MTKPSTTLAVLGALALSTLPMWAAAQEEDEAWSWENSTEVGFVTTSGNASSTTLSLKSSLTGSGGPNELKIAVGGIRASSQVTSRTAQGTTGSFVVVENTTTVESAANYFARARYDREIDGAFAFGGAGWERNTFAGFNHRYSAVAGLGRTWVDNDDGRFKTDVGGTYTIQEDIESEGDARGFGGVRTTIEAARTLTETTDLETTFVLDESLADTEDLRFDWLSSISVALTEGLALQTSYQLVFDNQPALLRIPLVTGGIDTGETVAVESEELDSFLTLSLVIKL
jgi:putative salt-induced outer membrane protein YdiY